MVKEKNPGKYDHLEGSELDGQTEGSWFVEDGKEVTGNYNLETGERDPQELMKKNIRGDYDAHKNSNQGGSEKMDDENQNVENQSVDQVVDNSTQENKVDEKAIKVTEAINNLEDALNGKGDFSIKEAYVKYLDQGEEFSGYSFLDDKEDVVERLISGPLERTSRGYDLLMSHSETVFEIMEANNLLEEISEDDKKINLAAASAFFTFSPKLYDILSPKYVAQFVESGDLRLDQLFESENRSEEDIENVIAYFRGESEDAIEQIDSLRIKQSLEYEAREKNYKESISDLEGKNSSFKGWLAALGVAAGIGIGGWAYTANNVNNNLGENNPQVNESARVAYTLCKEESGKCASELSTLKTNYSQSQDSLNACDNNLSESASTIKTLNQEKEGLQNTIESSWESRIKIAIDSDDNEGLLNVVDAYINNSGGSVAIKGNSCEMALTNLYGAMASEIKNTDLREKFVAKATDLCGEIDPNKTYVLFGKNK